jgi:hypothetical protein
MKIPDFNHNLSRAGFNLVHLERDFPSYHHGGKIRFTHIFDLDRIDFLSPSDDGAEIRNIFDLFKFMGDDDHCFTLVGQIMDYLDQVKNLLGSQYSRRLIQNQDICSSVESFQNLNTLLHPDSYILDRGGRIYGQPVFF